MTANDWRPIVAALANPAARELYANVVLGTDSPEPTSTRRQHAVDVLVRAGLIAIDDAGLAVVPDAFSRVLAAQPRDERPTGIERFLGQDGRITRFPSAAAERHTLFERVRDDVIADDEFIDEPELNDRLARWTDDIPRLRRDIVDQGLVDRTADGSRYTRAPRI